MEYAAIAASAAAVIGQLINMGMQVEAQNLRQRIADQYGPDILPELDRVTAQEVAKTSFGDIKEDPSLRDTQMKAIDALMQAYDQGGNTPADIAAMQLANDTVSRNAVGGQMALEQLLAQRGMGTSPAALASRQSTQQDRLATLGGMARQNAVDARQRALQALMGGASLAGDVRNTDYQHAANQAQAQDALNQFNASARERAANANNNLVLSAYDANMQRLAAQSNAINGVATGYQNLGQQAANMGAGVGQAALTWGTMKKKEE